MKRIALAALIVVTSACGSAPVPGASRGMNRSVLLPDEIQGARAVGLSAYDLISQLRPEYLRSRGATSIRNATPPTAAVYLDGVRYGDTQSLRNISAETIELVQYISASDATTRYGTDHVAGAILIKTKTQ